MTINIENNVFAEIGAGLTSGTLLLNIKGGKETLFPPAPFTLNLVKFNSTGTVLLREIVNVTGKAGNIFTITRAYEPVPVNDAALTTAQVAYDFDEGDMIYMTFTAGMFETIDSRITSLDTLKLDKTGGAVSGKVDLAKGSNLASASTVNLATATGNLVHITGTTPITALGTVQAGAEMCLIFDGITTLTHNATSLILPGAANRTTAVGDSYIFKSEGSGNWRCIAYALANGQAIDNSTSITALTEDTTGSLTADFLVKNNGTGSNTKIKPDKYAELTMAKLITTGFTNIVTTSGNSTVFTATKTGFINFHVAATHQDNQIGGVTTVIEYSTNGGSSYSTIKSVTNNSSGGSGTVTTVEYYGVFFVQSGTKIRANVTVSSSGSGKGEFDYSL